MRIEEDQFHGIHNIYLTKTWKDYLLADNGQFVQLYFLMLVVSIKLQFDNDGHLYSILLSLSPKNNDNLLEADTLSIFLLQIVLIFAVVNHFLLKVSSCRRNQGRGVAGGGGSRVLCWTDTAETRQAVATLCRDLSCVAGHTGTWYTFREMDTVISETCSYCSDKWCQVLMSDMFCSSFWLKINMTEESEERLLSLAENYYLDLRGSFDESIDKVSLRDINVFLCSQTT